MLLYSVSSLDPKTGHSMLLGIFSSINLAVKNLEQHYPKHKWVKHCIFEKAMVPDNYPDRIVGISLIQVDREFPCT